MTETGKPLSKWRRIWLILAAIIATIFSLFIVPVQFGLFLLYTDINPLHSYELKTCQGTLKLGGQNLPAEERLKLPDSIEFDLIESPPSQNITQTINHENYRSNFCLSNYIDLFGKENLVACYKSKESGKLTIYNPFGSKLVAVLSCIFTLIMILGPVRLGIKRIRTLLVNEELSKNRESSLNVAHWLCVVAISAIFFVKSLSDDIAHNISRNWKIADCKIVANCKPEDKQSAPVVVYEYSTAIGTIRSNEIRFLNAGENSESENELLNNLKSGDSISCYVNPDAPQQSSLFQARQFSFERYIIFFVLLVLWCWKGWPYLKSWTIKYDQKKRAQED